MEYNSRIIQLTEKWRAFHSDTTPGQMMVTVCPYTFNLDYKEWGIKPRPFSSWDFEKDAEEYVLRNKKMNEIFVEYTKDLDNDYVPAVGINMGYGVHSAYYTGAEVIFGEETSWTHPVLDNLADMKKFTLDANNPWYQRILNITRLYAKYQEGDYYIHGFSNAGPGDMANAIRGNDLFVDLFDEPELVKAFMDQCVEPVIWLEESIKEITGYINGGSITANCWFEGDAPYISMDFDDLCSAGQFREFGFHATQKILDHFSGGFMHHHMKGYHIHESLAKLNHLKLLEISWDPNLPKPIGFLDELWDMHGSLPLMVRCTAADVYKHIEKLKKGRVVIMLNIESLDEGREVIKFIRSHSRC